MSVVRPGASDAVSETARLTCQDGTTEEHVKALVVEREPVISSRAETAALALTIHAGDPYEALTLPEPEEEETADQSPADDEARGLFDRLGWWRPW